jgi:hypothetical protein
MSIRYVSTVCLYCEREFQRDTRTKRAFCSLDCKRRDLIQQRGKDDCWEWRGAVNTKGYGVFGHCRGERMAHRFAWIAENGVIPEGQFVLHRCDNRLCCNPQHLFLGSKADNNADMYRKGRDIFSKGTVRRIGGKFATALPLDFN